MPNDLVLPIDVATLPNGFCPADYQALANGLGAVFTVTFPSTFTGVSVSSTKPSDTTQAWLQLDSLGRPVRLYFFAQGAWLSMHPLVPGHTMIWTTALPDFTTFDGGDANGIGPASGAMWETVLSGKFPLGVGTLPSTATVAVGDVGGNDVTTITPTIDNLPPHTHICAAISAAGGSGSGAELFQANEVANVSQSNVNLVTNNAGGTGTPPVVTPYVTTNLPPYQAVYFLRRTARQFYAVT